VQDGTTFDGRIGRKDTVDLNTPVPITAAGTKLHCVTGQVQKDTGGGNTNTIGSTRYLAPGDANSIIGVRRTQRNRQITL